MHTTRSLLPPLLACAALGCVDPVSLQEPAPAHETSVGESRTVELAFLRFDVRGFKQTLTLADIQALPPSILEDTWLLDLDMTPFVAHALEQVSSMPPDQAAQLALPARHLWKLLNLTPESTDLSGTRLEGLLNVGKAVGLPPSLILADLTETGENAQLISSQVVAQAVARDVVSTHPNAQRRRGPVDEAHPDGLYPVKPGAIPVTLADVVNNFAGLATRYGPVPAGPGAPNAPVHPGFVVDASPVVATTEDFRMTVKVNLNALPYKGVDATVGTVASVNSTGGQIEQMFDFSDPSWLSLEGLTPDLRIPRLTMSIFENEAFLAGGDARAPLPTGNSPVWAAPPWQIEHLLATAGQIRAAAISEHCTSYSPEGTSGSSFTAVNVCIDATGWTDIAVDPSVILSEPPPPPSYFWDILLEVAQRRLHDNGLAEGAARVELTVEDVPIGLTTEELVAQIRANAQANPRTLRALAEQLNDNTQGDADFYYYQSAAGGDYLYFIAPLELRLNEDGTFVRPYAYAKPGFFADAALTQKLSTKEQLDGDSEHEKVRIEPGMTLYMEDDAGRRYEIQAGDKPSPHRIALKLTRLQ
jgi:hypothetical protein